jgi:hypothetical protein
MGRLWLVKWRWKEWRWKEWSWKESADERLKGWSLDRRVSKAPV